MSDRANPARGEAALTVGGEALTLRPTFEALVAAEEELGPLFALVERAADEALTKVDIAMHPAVEGEPLTAPPESPLVGQSWIAAAGAIGVWSGKDGMLASWTEGGWRFVAPIPGMLAWNKAGGHWLHWRTDNWSGGELSATALFIGGQKVVGERQPEVPSPSGGTVIDLEARAAIAAVTAALKSHGLIE